MQENSDKLNRALAFLGGAMVGAGIALVLAPQSGRKTRRLIRTRSRQVQLEVSRWLDDVAADVTTKLDEAVSHGREWTGATASQVRTALDSGRQLIREQVGRIVGS